jgi:hypothetical protein
MKKIFVFCVCVVLFCGCFKDGTPENVGQAKDDFEVTLLFEKDGVKVYRFSDGGNYRYFTSRGETMSTIQSGKTSRQESIQ